MKQIIEDYIRENEDFRWALQKQEGGLMKYLAEYLPKHPDIYVDKELLEKYRQHYYESFLKDNRGNYEVTFLEENEKKREAFGNHHLSKELSYQIALEPVLTIIPKEMAESVKKLIYQYIAYAWKENRRLYYPNGTPPDAFYREVINLYHGRGKACLCMDHLLREHHHPQIWSKKKKIDDLYNEFLILQYSDLISGDGCFKKLRQAVKEMTEGKTKEECRQIAVNTMMAVKDFSRNIYSTSETIISDCTGKYKADKEWLRKVAKYSILRAISHPVPFLEDCFAVYVLWLNEIGRIWAARLLVNGIDMHELEKETRCILFPVSEPTDRPDGRKHGNYRYYVDKVDNMLDNECCVGDEEQARKLLKKIKSEKARKLPKKIKSERDSKSGNKRSGVPEKPFIDFVVGKDDDEKNKVITIIKDNITNKEDVKKAALLICAAIETEKVLLFVTAPSIEREFEVKGNSIKPYLTKFRSAKKDSKIPSPFTEAELAPFIKLF